MGAAKHRPPAIGFEIGEIVHARFACRCNLIEHHGGDLETPYRGRGQSHQCLVDRADAVVDDDDQREPERDGEIGVQTILGQR